MFRNSFTAALALLVVPLFTTGSEVARTAAAGPELTVTAPQTGDVGQAAEIQLTLQGGAAVAGYESAVRFDESAAEFGGVLFGSGSGTGNVVSTLTTDPIGGVAFATYTCTVAGCPKADATAARDAIEHITVRLTPLTAGRLTVSLDQLKFVDLSGRSVDVAVPVHDVTIDVGGAGAQSTFAAQPVAYTLPADASATASAAVDVSGNGDVTSVDVNELAASWSDARRFGVCRTDLDADPNGDGCLDVADLQAAASATATQRAAAAATAAADGTVSSALTAPIVVNTTNDLPDSNIGNGKCVTANGDCSLRAAIHEANASPGPDTIVFNIPGGGVQTIQLTNPLPTITDGGLTIDGYTQPGSQPNTDPVISNAIINIGIRGNGSVINDPVNGFDAFKVVSGGNVFRGLAIYNVFNHFELSGASAVNNRIVGNFIGSDPTSTFLAPNPTTDGGSGITMISGANHNVVGTSAPADRNVIGGTPSTGVRIQHEGTNQNSVQGNLFGLKPHGDAGLRLGFTGVDIQFGAKNNTVGGPSTGERNVISGAFQANGIDLSHQEDTSGNVVENNFIGTTPSGNAVQPYTRNLRGVAFKDGILNNRVQNNVIGGTTEEALWVRFDFNGSNLVIGNHVGVALDGSAIPNAKHGMFVQGHDFQVLSNVFANNAEGGILVTAEAGHPLGTTVRNRLSGNTFGSNGGLAIDLAPVGPTANDAGDGDNGSNTNLNFPTFSPASTTSATGTACGGCRVEVYKAVADSFGRGVGQKLIGFDNAAANGSFNVIIGQVNVGDQIAGIAIDAVGNTSEFSPVANVTTVGAPPPRPPNTSVASLVPLQPARLLETRPGLPTVDGLFQGIGALSRGQTLELQVSGRGGVPADAEGVVLNVTVTEPVGSGFVTVYPCGSQQPLSSNVNYVAGQSVPNAVISRVGVGGLVCLFVSEGTHLVVDVNGYFPPATSFFSLVPSRLLDTRGQPTVDGLFQGPAPVLRDTTLPLTVLGRGGVPADATAVVLNVTATEPGASGFITVFPCGEGRPNASNLNFVGGQTVPNMAISRVGAGGAVCLYANETTHLVVDVDGYFSADASFVSLQPARLLETRTGNGLTTVDGQFNGLGRLARGQTLELQVAGRGGVSTGAAAAVLNVTAAGAVGSGFVTVFPCDQPQPVASSLNYLAGQSVPNAVVARLSATGTVCLFVSEATDLVADVDGYFFATP
jgi:CSLREA domain-containing protein